MDDENIFSAERMKEVAADIRNIRKKRELAEFLAGEIGRLNIMDLQHISAAVEKEIDMLPSPYRENIHPYFMEQFFGRYFKAMRMQGDGTFKTMYGNIEDEKIFEEYCSMLAGLKDYSREDDGMGLGPRYRGFYHLISCFAMFVLDEPGHPAGMPFPGGFAVERRDGAYYCPIRDKEKDVPFSICNFCPAMQSEMP
jgi:uncharacterized protein (UPF0305 family)